MVVINSTNLSLLSKELPNKLTNSLLDAIDTDMDDHDSAEWTKGLVRVYVLRDWEHQTYRNRDTVTEVVDEEEADELIDTTKLRIMT